MKDFEDKIYLAGEEVIHGLKGFFLNELKQGPFKIYDMSLSLFAASSGTIGVILALYKFFHQTLRANFSFFVLCIALFILFLSSVKAIFIVMPKFCEIGGDTELFSEYIFLMKKASRSLKYWMGLWLLGAILGIVALF